MAPNTSNGRACLRPAYVQAGATLRRSRFGISCRPSALIPCSANWNLHLPSLALLNVASPMYSFQSRQRVPKHHPAGSQCSAARPMSRTKQEVTQAVSNKESLMLGSSNIVTKHKTRSCKLRQLALKQGTARPSRMKGEHAIVLEYSRGQKATRKQFLPR